MTDLKPEDLRERAVSYRMGGPSSEHTAKMLDDAADRIDALLADRARMEKALREAERELAFAVEHMGRKGGGYERALVSVRQSLGSGKEF